MRTDRVIKGPTNLLSNDESFLVTTANCPPKQRTVILISNHD
jgi:hypothetical protein